MKYMRASEKFSEAKKFLDSNINDKYFQALCSCRFALESVPDLTGDHKTDMMLEEIRVLIDTSCIVENEKRGLLKVRAETMSPLEKGRFSHLIYTLDDLLDRD